MKWYKSIRKVLRDEPEIWLAYLHGQQLDNLKHLTESKPRYRGLPVQLLKFSYILMRTWRPFNSNNISQDESYFVFAGTSNQIDSLDSTVEVLKEKGATVTAISNRSLLDRQQRKERYVPLVFNSTDILKTMFLTVIRTPFLYDELRKLHPQAVSYWFADFCFIYAYLVYFQRVLLKTQPTFVITANDHNVANRCLLAVAHQLDIKTVYLQHASVSKFFPALRVNYAFLDGQSALDVYKQCEDNQPNTDRRVPSPKIFLSGQKKSIIKAKLKNSEKIGVALNTLDSIDLVIKFVTQLTDLSYLIVLRWHPGQTKSDIEKIRNAFENDHRVILSIPNDSRVGDFLACISWLVSGNSSIHLEAALANVIPIYYEFSPSKNYDYYGYIKSGLALEVSSVAELHSVLRNKSYDEKSLRDSIRYYSSTYQTIWEGKEGYLVVEVLESLKHNTKSHVEAISL